MAVPNAMFDYNKAMGVGMVNPQQSLPGGTNWATPTIKPITPGTGGSSTPDWSGSNGYMGNVQDYLGQGTAHVDATSNPLAGQNNPYLQSMVDSAGRDQRAYYDQFIAPKWSSGSSFGNTGLGMMEAAERNNQANTFADQVNTLRFDDHKLRSDLMERGAERQDTLNSGQRENNLTAGSTYGQLGQRAGEFNYSADYGQFADQQGAEQARINTLLNAMNANNNIPPTTPAQEGNPWAGAAAGAMAGANLYRQWGGGR